MAKRLLREPEIVSRSGLSRTTIWRKEKAGTFPKRIRISENAVAWSSEKFELWMADPAAWVEHNQHAVAA